MLRKPTNAICHKLDEMAPLPTHSRHQHHKPAPNIYTSPSNCLVSCDRCTEIAQSTSLALKYCRLASQPAANKAEANRHRTSNQSRGRARPVFVRKSACFSSFIVHVCAWVSSVNAFFVCEQEENQPPSPRRARNSTSKQQEEWSSSVWKVNKYNLLH